MIEHINGCYDNTIKKLMKRIKQNQVNGFEIAKIKEDIKKIYIDTDDKNNQTKWSDLSKDDKKIFLKRLEASNDRFRLSNSSTNSISIFLGVTAIVISLIIAIMTNLNTLINNNMLGISFFSLIGFSAIMVYLLFHINLEKKNIVIKCAIEELYQELE